jgi:RNA polymerase sigma factor (TIGR02999 family)
MHEGDDQARQALFASAYAELRRLAHARLRDGGRNTVLQTTSLVNESYLRYVKAGELRAEDRRALFAYASQVMRSVILEEVRFRMAEMRGGGAADLTLSTDLADGLPSSGEEILRVHDALLELETVNARLAQVVQMRYFGGYSEREIAEVLGVSDRTVRSDWERARLILAEALR